MIKAFLLFILIPLPLLASEEGVMLRVMNLYHHCDIYPLPKIIYTYRVSQFQGGVGAYFPGQNVIWLSKSLDSPDSEKHDEILAHELVHHLQFSCGKPQNEAEAYEIQRKFSEGK